VNAEAAVALLEGLDWHPVPADDGGWWGQCLICNDTLRITEGDGGEAVFECSNGCDRARVTKKFAETALREAEGEPARTLRAVPDPVDDHHDDLREDPSRLPPPTQPMAVARVFADERCRKDHHLVVRHWRGQWWEWKRSHWAEVELRKIRAEIYEFTEYATFLNAEGESRPWAPSRTKVANVLEALGGITLLSQGVDQPAWLNGDAPAATIVACANGLLDVERRTLLDHTPSYFNQTSVPFDFDPGAPQPLRWLCFLDDLWGDNEDQINTLQEWFGYALSGRLDLHKIFLLVGPTRAGKGVIARVLGSLIGRANVAGPTLSSLRGDFGLAPLIGKPLAVIADARLSGRDSSTVVERLLSISGEDLITVNIKYREQWTGKLPSRFMVLSNELPRLGDASAAIAGRFVTLQLTKDWYGKENLNLERELREELTGILNWALDGLARLVERGKFTRPEATELAFRALQDLASPVGAFVREACVKGPEHSVEVDELWRAWRTWSEENGHGKGSKQKFGADLRAVIPQLKRTRPRGDGPDDQRPYQYEGVGLPPAGGQP
jgi:putative DNA primase/helicase